MSDWTVLVRSWAKITRQRTAIAAIGWLTAVLLSATPCQAQGAADLLIMRDGSQQRGTLEWCSSAVCSLNGKEIGQANIAWIGLGGSQPPTPPVGEPARNEIHFADKTVLATTTLRLDANFVTSDQKSHPRATIAWIHLVTPPRAPGSAQPSGPRQASETRTYMYDVTFRSVLKNEGSGYVKTDLFCCGEREWVVEVTSTGRFPDVRVTVKPRLAGVAELMIRSDTPNATARVTGQWRWFHHHFKENPVDVNCKGEMTWDVPTRMGAGVNVNRTNNTSSDFRLQFSTAARVDLGANCERWLPVFHKREFTWNGLNVSGGFNAYLNFEQKQVRELASPVSELLTGQAFTLDTGTHAYAFSDCAAPHLSKGVECRSRIRSEQRYVVIFTPKQ